MIIFALLNFSFGILHLIDFHWHESFIVCIAILATMEVAHFC